jgi:hypothetical protein
MKPQNKLLVMMLRILGIIELIVLILQIVIIIKNK